MNCQYSNMIFLVVADTQIRRITVKPLADLIHGCITLLLRQTGSISLDKQDPLKVQSIYNLTGDISAWIQYQMHKDVNQQYLCDKIVVIVAMDTTKSQFFPKDAAT